MTQEKKRFSNIDYDIENLQKCRENLIEKIKLFKFNTNDCI